MVWVVVGCVAQFCGVMLTVRSENVAVREGSAAAGSAVPARGGRFEKEEVCQNTLDY